MGRILGVLVPLLLLALLLFGDVSVAFGGVRQAGAIGIGDEAGKGCLLDDARIRGSREPHGSFREIVAESVAFLPLVLGSGMAPGPTSTPTPTATATQTPTPTPTSTWMPPTGCRIAYLQYEGTDEYVRIRNFGLAPQDMTGWRIHSVTGDQWYTFPQGYVLDPDASVWVHSGPDGQDGPPGHLLWTNAHVWNNQGDVARLIDSHGQDVDSWAY